MVFVATLAIKYGVRISNLGYFESRKFGVFRRGQGQVPITNNSLFLADLEDLNYMSLMRDPTFEV